MELAANVGVRGGDVRKHTEFHFDSERRLELVPLVKEVSDEPFKGAVGFQNENNAALPERR